MYYEKNDSNQLKRPSHWLFHPPPKISNAYIFHLLFMNHIFIISAPAVTDTYSNNHNLVHQVLSELLVKFHKRKILVIRKNSKRQKRGTPDTTFLDKPYSMTKLSEVLIKEPDYLHFKYVGGRGEKEIEIEKEFDVSIRFSLSTQHILDCRVLNLKFSQNKNRPCDKGTYLITIRLYTSYTINKAPTHRGLFYKNFQRTGQGGYDRTKCFFNACQKNFLDIHSTLFFTYTRCEIDQC